MNKKEKNTILDIYRDIINFRGIIMGDREIIELAKQLEEIYKNDEEAYAVIVDFVKKLRQIV